MKTLNSVVVAIAEPNSAGRALNLSTFVYGVFSSLDVAQHHWDTYGDKTHHSARLSVEPVIAIGEGDRRLRVTASTAYDQPRYSPGL